MVTPIRNTPRPPPPAKATPKTEKAPVKELRRVNPETSLLGYSPARDPHGLRGRLVDVWA